MTGQISKYFTWKEALWLPQWKRMGDESDGLTSEMCENLEVLFFMLDRVREIFDRPIIVHVAWRSIQYNKLIGGANASAHLAMRNEAAVDFHVKKMDCEDAKEILLPELERLGLRMEDNGLYANWIHLDTRLVRNGNRYFKP